MISDRYIAIPSSLQIRECLKSIVNTFKKKIPDHGQLCSQANLSLLKELQGLVRRPDISNPGQIKSAEYRARDRRESVSAVLFLDLFTRHGRCHPALQLAIFNY